MMHNCTLSFYHYTVLRSLGHSGQPLKSIARQTVLKETATNGNLHFINGINPILFYFILFYSILFLTVTMTMSGSAILYEMKAIKQFISF